MNPDIITDHPLANGVPPSWACGWGEDAWGPFVEVDFGELEVRLRWIPPGQFQMGSPEDEPERSLNEQQHWVRLTRGFWAFDKAVTQQLWQMVMGENPSHFQGHLQLPVENVSWEDTQEFLQKANGLVSPLNLRLPTEAEWEYACRAGTTTAFNTGQNISTDRANYDGNYPMPDSPAGEYREKTLPCGSFPPNDWGLFDMHGNVWEWCADWHGEYAEGPVTDPAGPADGANRVVRGGAWNYHARPLRSAFRRRHAPGYRNFNIGFRCVSSG